jgi:hypothetical protein
MISRDDPGFRLPEIFLNHSLTDNGSIKLERPSSFALDDGL